MGTATTSRRSTSHASRGALAASQTTSGADTAVLAGVLNLDAEAPSVTGRGRQKVIDPTIRDYIVQMLKVGRGTVTSPVCKDINAVNSYHLKVQNAADDVAAAEGLEKVKIHWVTNKPGRLPSAANAKTGAKAHPGVFPLTQTWYPHAIEADASK